jgi:hypothetical protein
MTVRVDTFPHNKPESLVAEIRRAYYPQDRISRVELELQAYMNGEFHFTYCEEQHGEIWMCRWDRHENPHNTRDHIHLPPNAQTEDAVDKDYPTDLEYVLRDVVFSWIEDRIGEVWDTENV